MYVSELRTLAEFCNFTSLEEMLRDRLVCGINHDRTQNRLLSEAKLTYEKAMEIAQSQETAAQNLKELKNNPQPKEEVSFRDKPVLKVESGGKPKFTCYRCGKEGHLANKCKFINAECRNCGKTGHLQAVCRSKPKQSAGKDQKKEHKKVHQVEEETEYPLFYVDLDDQPLTMELDTGASFSLISERTDKEVWPDISCQSRSSLKVCSQLRPNRLEPTPFTTISGSLAIWSLYLTLLPKTGMASPEYVLRLTFVADG